MNLKGIAILLLFVSFSKIGNCQQLEETISGESILKMLKYDGITAFGGLKHAYSRPLHWQKDDFFTLGTYFIRQEKKIPKVLKDFGWYFGKPQYNYMLSASIYGVGLFTRNKKIRHTGVLLISSATAAGLIQTVSKNIVGRARPQTLKGNGAFKPFSKKGSYHSFPSGHTILSFTTAHAIAKQFDNWWLKVGIYGVGAISPVSRLWAGAHWLTDVALGGVLSVVIVDSIDNYLKDNNKYGFKKQRTVSWKFNLRPNKIGLIGTF